MSCHECNSLIFQKSCKEILKSTENSAVPTFLATNKAKELISRLKLYLSNPLSLQL